MPIAFIRHRVRDYETWRRVYDEFTRADSSDVAVEPAVYRSPDDPNEVLVVHPFGSSAEVEPWLHDTGRRRAMLEAGVLGTPRIAIADDEA
jgi:hypothetical protein